MKLFVANCTRQHHEFTFVFPETGKVIPPLIIPAGHQIQVMGELTSATIDGIVAQHERYGMRRADASVEAGAYTGLCYSIDKPVKSEKITDTAAHNERVLGEIAKQARIEAAAATGALVSDQSGGRVSGISLELEEQIEPTADREAVSEVIEVVAPGSKPKRGRG